MNVTVTAEARKEREAERPRNLLPTRQHQPVSSIKAPRGECEFCCFL